MHTVWLVRRLTRRPTPGCGAHQEEGVARRQDSPRTLSASSRHSSVASARACARLFILGINHTSHLEGVDLEGGYRNKGQRDGTERERKREREGGRERERETHTHTYTSSQGTRHTLNITTIATDARTWNKTDSRPARPHSFYASFPTSFLPLSILESLRSQARYK